jgi:hypothetical protein
MSAQRMQRVGTHVTAYCITIAVAAAAAGAGDFGLSGFIILGIILAITISVRFFYEGTVPVVGRPQVPGASAPHSVRDETVFKVGPILYAACFFVGHAAANAD